MFIVLIRGLYFILLIKVFLSSDLFRVVIRGLCGKRFCYLCKAQWFCFGIGTETIDGVALQESKTSIKVSIKLYVFVILTFETRWGKKKKKKTNNKNNPCKPNQPRNVFIEEQESPFTSLNAL